MTKYSFLKGLIHTLKFVGFAIVAGLIVGLKPEIKELTIGGILVLAYNYIKINWINRLP